MCPYFMKMNTLYGLRENIFPSNVMKSVWENDGATYKHIFIGDFIVDAREVNESSISNIRILELFNENRDF
jgi:hypothetical protein